MCARARTHTHTYIYIKNTRTSRIFDCFDSAANENAHTRPLNTSVNATSVALNNHNFNQFTNDSTRAGRVYCYIRRAASYCTVSCTFMSTLKYLRKRHRAFRFVRACVYAISCDNIVCFGTESQQICISFYFRLTRT